MSGKMIECEVCKGKGKVFPTIVTEEDVDALCKDVEVFATLDQACAKRGFNYISALKDHIIGENPKRPHWALKIDAARAKRLEAVFKVGDKAAADKNMAGVKWAECKLFGFDKAGRWRKDKQQLSSMPQVLILQGDAVKIRELYTQEVDAGGTGDGVFQVTAGEAG